MSIGSTVSSVKTVLRVTDVEVECIIGIYPQERHTPQPLSVSMAFELDTRPPAHEENHARTVDYARVVAEAAFVLQRGAFLLIETAAEAVCAAVLSGLESPSDMELSLKKPRALGGNGVASLTVRRGRDVSQALWTFSFGVVEVVWNAHGFGIYRVRLNPNAAVTLPPHVTVLAAGQGRPGVFEPIPSSTLNTQQTTAHSYLVTARPPVRLDAFIGV